MGLAKFLDRESIIAKPGFNRWLIPPAGLAIHLSIGQIYSYSVVKSALLNLEGVSWQATDLFWIFSIAIFFLGLSAATFGKWMERVGPRKAMFVAAICFSAGFFVAAAGVYTRQLWLVYLGNGVIGGIGLGIGYISPVSTLMKWFPDKPGFATGMAIMGFGGGAMIAAPVSSALFDHFGGIVEAGKVVAYTTSGVGTALAVMGVFYFFFMMFGMFNIRIPAPNWKPEGWVPKPNANKMVSNAMVDANTAIKTPQFWLLFAVLFLNITAGIGVLEDAKPMILHIFSDARMGAGIGVSAATATGFVGFLSIFNMGGRLGWSTLSDKIGRKNTYLIYQFLGAIVVAMIPMAAGTKNLVIYVILVSTVISFYGGGFGTVPAYLKDLFGTLEVGAIHGRLLMAWSLAGVFGPFLVNYLVEYNHHHVAGKVEALKASMPAGPELSSKLAELEAGSYDMVFYIMAALLIVGVICNVLIKPVDKKYHHQG
ncbi:MFS transporter [Fulvitalea axinellae]|uniref:MFS transporter n=1 Tax=Fulvitalea axinellae TaxID=1182444 RepID=A0AAU9CLT3_9BACT|nr:MFS transporter [Fulvitalea axinellae]